MASIRIRIISNIIIQSYLTWVETPKLFTLLTIRWATHQVVCIFQSSERQKCVWLNSSLYWNNKILTTTITTKIAMTFNCHMRSALQARNDSLSNGHYFRRPVSLSDNSKVLLVIARSQWQRDGDLVNTNKRVLLMFSSDRTQTIVGRPWEKARN